MKTAGLIGGMSWESTVPYYQVMNRVVGEALGGLHSAKVVLYSVDFQEIEELQHGAQRMRVCAGRGERQRGAQARGTVAGRRPARGQACQAPAPRVRLQGGLADSGAKVAILDGGFSLDHPDIATQYDPDCTADMTGEGIAYGPNSDDPTGIFAHGMHTAGTVAAAMNMVGTIGVAPDAKLCLVKVLFNYGSGSFEDVAEGIVYAADKGVDIINMSLGALFARGGGNTGAGYLVGAMARAVNYATERNVLVVSAAGNDSVDLDHSASYIKVPAESGSGIAVSATGPIGYAVGYPNGNQDFARPASYTNYGHSVIWLAAPGGDFALPGEDICTMPRVPSGSSATYCWVFDMVISCSRGQTASISTYSYAAGTSMATPAAAAVAALVKQRFPGMLVGDLKTHLARTADGSGPYYGHGFVNALRAVTE
mgnify:CR=1 FL=1